MMSMGKLLIHVFKRITREQLHSRLEAQVGWIMYYRSKLWVSTAEILIGDFSPFITDAKGVRTRWALWRPKYLRVPNEQTDPRGMPTGFGLSKQLQFGVCKASSGKCQMSALHSQMGESKLWGQKCSIILQWAILGNEVSCEPLLLRLKSPVMNLSKD